jgi:type II secretory pathway component PulJ
MRKLAASHDRPGYVFLDVLVLLALLGVVMALSMAILRGAQRMIQASAAQERHLLARAELAELFRADVASARTTLDALGDDQASDQCLLLELADGRCIRYRWADGLLKRALIGKDSALPTDRVATPLLTIESASFSRRDGTARPLVELRWRERGQPREVVIRVALGGDLR